MGEHRRALVRVTLEGLGAALGLPEGIEVLGVQEEREWAQRPRDVLVLIEDRTGARVPIVQEGETYAVIAREGLVRGGQ